LMTRSATAPRVATPSPDVTASTPLWDPSGEECGTAFDRCAVRLRSYQHGAVADAG
jgi:hypothetical protein